MNRAVYSTKQPSRPLAIGPRELQVSRFDQVSSLLVALLILSGFGVFCLAMIWFGSRLPTFEKVVPVTMAVLEEEATGPGDGSGGEVGMTLDEPLADELGEDVDLPAPQVQQTLSVISQAVAAQQADFDTPALTGAIESGKGGWTGGKGRLPGSGQGGGGSGGIARPQRWEIMFPPGGSLETYARQLDYFGIELGLVGSDGVVTYVSNLAQRRPETRQESTQKEERMYMTWQQGELRDADLALVQRAGLDAQNKVLVQFIPATVENQLAQLERSYRNREPKKIRKTRFGVRTQGDGFEFYVADQVAL
jgi:hypothetical protein